MNKKEKYTSYIINTNIKENKEHHNSMLKDGKIATYREKYGVDVPLSKDKYHKKIQRLKYGDTIFLYKSGVKKDDGGIVAYGYATGDWDYFTRDGIEKYECFMKLDNFKELTKIMRHDEVVRIIERTPRQTSNGIYENYKELLIEEIEKNYL